MEFSGERVIGASQERVYDALHDPVVLRQAIPGIQSLTKVDTNKFELLASLKVGPFRPTFSGAVELYNQDRPSGYSLRGSATSANGSAAGSAHVALAAIDSETTNLAYHISVDLDGQLGAIESVRLETTARTLTAEFFSRLQTLLDGETIAPPPAEELTPGPEYSAAAITTAAPSSATTDATGGYVVSSRPTHYATTTYEEAAEDGAYPTGGATAIETSGFDAPRSGRRAEPESSGGGIGRWIGVIVGLILIAALLNNNFAN